MHEKLVHIEDPILKIIDLSISYEEGKPAVSKVTAGMKKSAITAIMGPSGCGKSTLIRAFNRMHDLYPNIQISGSILLNGTDILQGLRMIMF